MRHISLDDIERARRNRENYVKFLHALADAAAAADPKYLVKIKATWPSYWKRYGNRKTREAFDS